MIKFIDISQHNTILALDAIKDSDLKGVIIKATEGTTHIDHICDIFYETLKGKNNLGFYHYLTSTSSPITQARNFWNKIKDKQYQIYPVLDVEQDTLGKKAEQYAKEFILEFNRLSGQKMLIYSGRCYIEEHFSDEFRKKNNWWVADYSAKKVPTISGCNIVAWQYTESSREYRFALGDLDVNYLVQEEGFYIKKISTPIKENNSIAILQIELNKIGSKLIVDGIAGKLTLAECPTIRIGAKGNIVLWVQTMIMSKMYKRDGILGENTRQAIIDFQRKKGLHTDGVVGKLTWAMLLGLKVSK